MNSEEKKEEFTELEEEKNDIEVSEKPFATKDIKISNQIITIYGIISKLKYNEIDLNPDFQRNANLWNNQKMSQLIESILLRLPLPIFYFDISDPDKWIIVDGLQRLSTIQKFAVDKKLKLKGLEFLTDLNGKSYDDLEPRDQRVINDTNIITYQIEAQTPKEVRYSIFKRINTGGLTLNSQEIRQALNQRGKGISFLKEVSQEEVFKDVVNMSPKRMLDRELILRFIAFTLTPYAFKNFRFNTMGEFLDNAMEDLDEISKLEEFNSLKDKLLNALTFSEEIFGVHHHFSKAITLRKQTRSLNRSLFDVITVLFSKLSENEKSILLKNKNMFIEKFDDLLLDDKSDFSRAITEGTSGKKAIESRFKIMDSLIKEVLNEY